MKIFGGRMLVFVIVLVILCVIFGLAFIIYFHSAPDKTDEHGEITYYYGGTEKRIAKTASCIDGGIVYFCFNDLSDYLGFHESGDAANLKFVIPSSGEDEAENAVGVGNEEYVIFDNTGKSAVINGQEVKLAVPNKLMGNEIWVASSFIGDYMNGVSLTYSESKSQILISRIKDEESSTKDTTVYLMPSFKLKSIKPIEPIPEDPLVGEDTYELDFKTDLSAYEQYMNPPGELRDAFLILVNTKNTLDADDIPNDLVDVKSTSVGATMQQMRSAAASALEALYIEMKASGFYNMSVHSGYRSYDYQKNLFAYYTNNEMAKNPALTTAQAEAIVLTYSTRAGTSEHQTGLAVDMDTRGDFSTDFQYTEEYGWLSENAWKFGFILRFPADKTDITTIQFEPWHYRYVGRYHAKKIHDAGLCLEEYIDKMEK